MNIRSWFAPEVWRLDRTAWVLVCVTFAGMMVFYTTPWLAAACCLAITGTFLLLVRSRTGPIAAAPAFPPYLTYGFALAAYIALSVAWSRDPLVTLLTAVLIAMLLMITALMERAVTLAPQPWLEHATRCILVATLAAFSFLLFEELTGHAIKRRLFWPFRALRLRDWSVGFDPDHVVTINEHTTNWNMPLVAIMIWPVMVICNAQFRWRDRPWVKALVLLLGAATIFSSRHWTSMVAVAAACLVFALAKFAQQRTYSLSRLLKAAWLASFLAVIPLATWGYAHDWHLDERLKPSFRARIILWGVTAERFWSHPWLGVGAASTKRTDKETFRQAEADQPRDFVYARRTGPHAHNFLLQSWYELGLAGTALFAAFGLALITAISQSRRRLQPYLLALATTIVVIGLSSFGLFEPWLLGGFAMTAAACMMGAEYERRLAPYD